MKNKPTHKAVTEGEMRAEYDFSMGVRNRYAKALRENGYTIRVYRADGTFTEKRIPSERTVVLEPDVQEYFPTSQAVNQALRALISIIPQKRNALAKNPRSAPKPQPRRNPQKSN